MGRSRPRRASARAGGVRPAAARRGDDSPDLLPVVIDGRTVGQVRANPRTPAWSLMRFAEAAAGGIGSDDAEGVMVMMRLIRRSVHPDDLGKLERLLDEHEPTPEELLGLVRAVISGQTGRPTVRPSVSSDGPLATGRTSRAGSSSPVTVPPGRPDLQLVAEMVPVEELASLTGTTG